MNGYVIRSSNNYYFKLYLIWNQYFKRDREHGSSLFNVSYNVTIICKPGQLGVGFDELVATFLADFRYGLTTKDLNVNGEAKQS